MMLHSILWSTETTWSCLKRQSQHQVVAATIIYSLSHVVEMLVSQRLDLNLKIVVKILQIEHHHVFKGEIKISIVKVTKVADYSFLSF